MKPATSPDGVTRWVVNGYLHRDDGPAVILPSGTQIWYQHGERYREDGPALIDAEGTEYWYSHGQCHRENAPAIICTNGSEAWYQHDVLHRVDGPAFTDDVGYHWYLKGLWIRSAHEFQLKAGLSDEDMMLLLLKYGDIK